MNNGCFWKHEAVFKKGLNKNRQKSMPKQIITKAPACVSPFYSTVYPVCIDAKSTHVQCLWLEQPQWNRPCITANLMRAWGKKKAMLHWYKLWHPCSHCHIFGPCLVNSNTRWPAISPLHSAVNRMHANCHVCAGDKLHVCVSCLRLTMRITLWS